MNEIKLVFGRHFDAVYLDGAPLDPGPSQRLFNHSPDGFAWGYGGSGPAQLALALLLAAGAPDHVAVKLHQSFKEDFVSHWPQESGTYHVDINLWVEGEMVKRPDLVEA